MTRACHGPVRAATGEAFSDEEIDDILDRLARRHKRVKAKAPTASDEEAWRAAAGELTKEELETALQARRLEAFAKRAAAARAGDLSAMTGAGLNEAEALRAYNVGSEKQAPGAARSVDAEGRARAVAAWGDVERGLAAHEGLTERLANWWGGGDPAFDRDVAREMARLTGAEGIEATGDADALHAAQVFTAALEKNRQDLNAQGAFVGKLKGRVAAQAHDRLKVAGGFWREFAASGPAAPLKWGEARLAASRKAFREWRDFIRPKLDPATFDGLDASDVQLEEAAALHAAGVLASADDLEERFLYRAWWNIVTGGHEVLGGASDLAEFRPPPGKARAVSKHRVLHFSTPDAWMDYHARFGRGSLYGVVMGELERGGRNAALMARWGPSPEAAFDNTLGALTEQARGRGDAGAANALASRQRRAEFEELTGETSRPDNLRLAIVGRSIRASQILSKLGGMVLSALSDTSLASQAYARAGGTFAAGYAGAFRGIARLQDAEGRAAADLLDVGARSAASHLMGRFTATDGPLGWSAWAQRVFYRVNGFEAWADGLRRGVGEMLAAHWGTEAAQPWATLQAGTRETFERFGIDARAWELVRGGVSALEDGRTYFSFEAIDALDDGAVHRWAGLQGKAATKAAAGRLRDDLRLRFQTMTGAILDDALTEARARERVGLTRGLKAGTVWGEAVRTFTQFWSFSAAVMGRHLAPAARGFGGRAPAALLAHLIVSSTLMGYLSMQAKQLAKGRTPRPIDRPEAWAAALLQGGGLGIYGDFLFGEYARNGLPATISSFAGPAVSEAERLRLVVGAAVGTLNPLTAPDDREKAGRTFEAQGFRLVKDNLPFSNLWYTRLALDYLVLWRLQEAISPGYLQRYEQAVKENEGSEFIVAPTSALN